MFGDLSSELAALDARMARVDGRLTQSVAESDLCQRLAQVEGVGPMIATAMAAAVSDSTAFKNGRQLAAWRGLVPRQQSRRGKQVWLGISTRGDRDLRSRLIHGARAVGSRAATKTDARSRWITEKQCLRGTHRTCVAVANKNARILWAFMAQHEPYQRVASEEDTCSWAAVQ